ncbi:tetratricopeptide repeat protein [uncultured Massilia sp.]|uniref:tetratricopeptide repeat protein n=1 Tax=uncultured Massilia sp. TaxID=169973 RepID=UPI0025E274DF|nr:tetratricopeptide repeat protein [uncultured Massilia sp.]
MYKTLPAAMAALVATAAFAAPADDAVARLQQRWAEIKYATPAAEQERGFQALAAEADQTLARYPDRAEVLIWHGIVVASYAGAKGGLGALGLAKDARKDFESALKIDRQALSGSAYTSLGSLYYQVPGWPIGFGDDKKAVENLKQGLAVDPASIDANYFYGDYLFRNGKYDEAETYLRKALQAPPRAGRKLADEGRRKEIDALLEKIAAKRR